MSKPSDNPADPFKKALAEATANAEPTSAETQTSQFASRPARPSPPAVVIKHIRTMPGLASDK